MAECGEEWRPIPGFTGYFASSLGRIASERGRRGRRILRQWSVSSEWLGHSYIYPAVCLVGADKKRCHRSVGRYVLMAFTGEDDPEMLCLHKDGDPFNNTPGNLMWGTARDNARDRRCPGFKAREEVRDE